MMTLELIFLVWFRPNQLGVSSTW